MQRSSLREFVKRIPGARSSVRAFRNVFSKTTNPRLTILNALPKGGIGMEIGVHKGDFSRQLLEVAQPKVLHLVDPWEHKNDEIYKNAWYGGVAKGGPAELDARYMGVRQRFSSEIETGRVVLHRMYSDAALKTFDDNSLDWVYIDGNHIYEFVLNDLRYSWAKVHPGGLVCGDDYGSVGWWQDGVTRAVTEFTDELEIAANIVGNQFLLRVE